MDTTEAKNFTAKRAKGCYIVYLDCDCIPAPGWLEEITGPLRDGSAVAVGGFARYPGGWFAALCSLMDFGFLLPRVVSYHE